MCCVGIASTTLQSVRYSYKLIQLMTPAPKKLALITTARGKPMLCLAQLYKELVQEHCPYTTFMSKVNTHNNRKQLQLLQQADRAMLVNLGAIQAKANTVGIVTHNVAYAAMRVCGVPSSTLHAFKAISTHPASLMILPLPQYMLQPCSMPSTNPDQLQMMGSLPKNIPAYDDDSGNLRQGSRYGLWYTKPAVAALAPLSMHMKEMEEFCCQPINFDRPFNSHCSRTWENTSEFVSLFLGYCFWKHSVSQPTLQHFLSPDLLTSYLSFKLSQKHSINTIRQFIAVAKYVLQFWQSKPGGKHASLQQAIEWLDNMPGQVRLVMSSIMHADVAWQNIACLAPND